MRTIDPTILLTAMASLPAPRPTPAVVHARARRVQYAPLTPPAISVSRAA